MSCSLYCKEIYRQDAGIVTLYKCQSRNVTGLIELCTDRRAVLCLGWARLGATGLPCSDAYRSRLSLCRNKAVFTQISAVGHYITTDFSDFYVLFGEMGWRHFYKLWQIVELSKRLSA